MGVKNDMAATAGANNISEDEAALYDRQIRLWGVENQKRIRNANLLIVGLNGLGLEIVKNLTLTGVKSITIIDNTAVSVHDSSAQFYACQAPLGQKRSEASRAAIQELNPNVKIEIDSEDISSKTADFVKNFSVVFITDHPIDVMIALNKQCKENKVLFYCGDTWGFYGYGFCDLGVYASHSIYKEQALKELMKKEEKTGQKLKLTLKEKIQYSTLEECYAAKIGAGMRKKCNNIYFLAIIMKNFRATHNRFPQPQTRTEDLTILKEVRENTLKELGVKSDAVPDEMLELSFGELSPICAVIGGEIANEIIKALSMKPWTMDNFFLFDGPNTTGVVERIA